MRLVLTCLGGLLAACSTPDADALRPEPWIAVAPEDAGFDGGAIVALLEELRRGDHGAVDHFILIRDGRKVVDERFRPAGYRTLIDQTGSSPRPAHDSFARPTIPAWTQPQRWLRASGQRNWASTTCGWRII